MTAARDARQGRTIIAMDVYDVRFPTSEHQDGSDAMFPDPDYSAAYVVLRTDTGDGLEGHGLTFTIGRGNDIVCAQFSTACIRYSKDAIPSTINIEPVISLFCT